MWERERRKNMNSYLSFYALLITKYWKYIHSCYSKYLIQYWFSMCTKEVKNCVFADRTFLHQWFIFLFIFFLCSTVMDQLVILAFNSWLYIWIKPYLKQLLQQAFWMNSTLQFVVLNWIPSNFYVFIFANAIKFSYTLFQKSII